MPGNTRLLLIQFIVLILRLSMTVLCFISSWSVSASIAIVRFDDVVLVVFDITAVDPILSAVCEMDMVDFLKSMSNHLRPSNSERRIPVANANLIGKPTFTMHGTRHTHATLLIENGAI